MQRCRRRWTWFSFCLIVVGIFLSPPSFADTRITPEFTLYLTHNNIFRSRFSTAATWNRNSEEFSSSAFEYDLDIGMGSFFRRYVFKDPNAEKSKFVTIRLGYAYIPNLTTSDNDLDEQRGMTDITLRLPIGKAWLLSDRTRVDYRYFENADTVRYRNRLRAERNIALGKFRITPYANAEVYYDDKINDWNQFDATAGAEFPWRYSTVLEIYYTWQDLRPGSDGQLVGITLQKHL